MTGGAGWPQAASRPAPDSRISPRAPARPAARRAGHVPGPWPGTRQTGPISRPGLPAAAAGIPLARTAAAARRSAATGGDRAVLRCGAAADPARGGRRRDGGHARPARGHPSSSTAVRPVGHSAARVRRQAGRTAVTSGRGPNSRASRSADLGASRPA